MGEYNPHVPQILGEEWVPIRDEDVTFTPSVHSLEVGHAFRLAQSRTLQSLRMYVHDPAPVDEVYQISVYPRGMEAASGPIRRVLIPVNNGGTTGTGITVGGGSVAAALLSPDDGTNISFTEIGVQQQNVELFFATNSYPELNGKRILRVNLRYVAWMDPRVTATNNSATLVSAAGTFFSNLSDQQGVTIYDQDGFVANVLDAYGRMNFGEVLQSWDPANPSSVERLPWNYTILQRFEASASNRISVRILIQLNPSGNTDNTTAYIKYAALEVYYCEEQRVAIAGGPRNIIANTLGPPGTTAFPAHSVNGGYTANPTLAAGDYVVTLSTPDRGDLLSANNTGQAKFNGLREYYAIPPHQGVQVNIPAPIDESHVGDYFTREQIHVLPQLSLHTSGGPLTEVHVYGRQAVAQVYGTITATQEILDSAAGASYTWPQVRYYARRFGNTTAPLLLDSPSITGAGNKVSITPGEWDALDEIIDGWKEITLRFPDPPIMGAGTNPQWRWSSAGELAGHRWEVLGCTAPALTGSPGNIITPVPSPHQLSNATYGAPNSGSTINMGWVPQYAPGVTATADDQTSDAVLIFSQDPPPVTGFSILMTSQAVTGIGFDCGAEPCCIPSAIWYNRLTWSPPTGTAVFVDSFDRTQTGWGSPWTDSGGTVEGNYPVDGDRASHVLDSANIARFSSITASVGDIHQLVQAKIDLVPTSSFSRSSLMAHLVDTSNFDVVEFRWQPNASGNDLEIVIGSVVGGALSAPFSISVGAYGADEDWYLEAEWSGSQVRARAWPVGSPQPDWQIGGTASFTVGGYGIRSVRSGAETTTLSYDNYQVSPSSWNFGAYELQRFDDITAEWQTIMLATNPAVTGFSDFEARVGILSSYRIRINNVYNFSGPWSSTVTETIDEPGVQVGCEGHLLIFTSNSRQDGSINLAYSSTWDAGAVANEDFDFPESEDTILQKMYGKNFATAFRPLERGGERFTRNMLVQAAAISPPTLGDFTDLRDMAWDVVPYICVRDEDGNRWFATIFVPSGRVQLNRTLYFAPVTVQEVTDTAYPVDP